MKTPSLFPPFFYPFLQSPTTVPRRDSLNQGQQYRWNQSQQQQQQVPYVMGVPRGGHPSRISPNDRRGNSPTTNLGGHVGTPPSGGMYNYGGGGQHRPAPQQFMQQQQQQNGYRGGVGVVNFGTPERGGVQQQQQMLFQQQFGGSPAAAQVAVEAQSMTAPPTTQRVTRENTNFEKVLQALLKTHMPEKPAELVPTLICLEKVFWDYLLKYRTASAKQGLPTFEKGLFRDFLSRVIGIDPNLVGVKKENAEKTAEFCLTQFWEYKMTQPVAGVALMNHDFSKVLLVRDKPCTDGWALPKTKILPGEEEETAAKRALLQKTGLSLGSKILEGNIVRFEMERGNFKQPQIMYVTSVKEDDIALTRDDCVWKATQPPIPYLHGKTAGPIPPEYETVAVTLKHLASTFQHMLSYTFVCTLFVTHSLHHTHTQLTKSTGDGPPIKIKEVPQSVLNYEAVRERLIQTEYVIVGSGGGGTSLRRFL